MDDTSDWIQIGSAAFAALAAGAAWMSAWQQRRNQRYATYPNVAASFIVVRNPVPRAFIQFTNAGPGLSTHLGYFGISKDEGFAGTAGKGHLLSQERTEVLLPIQPPDPYVDEQATFIWASRDIYQNRLHIWSYNGRYKSVRAKPATKDWPRLDNAFRMMYPNVEIPPNVQEEIDLAQDEPPE
jgi:hypothetical protein